MTKKDYEKFAEMFNEHKQYAIEPGQVMLFAKIVSDTANILSEDNPQFNADKFCKKVLSE